MRFFTGIMILGSMLLALAGCNPSATPLPIVIGHVSDKARLDKAGDQAELGIRLALHELTKDGALAETFGGRKIQVRHTDTRGEIDAFESQAVRLDSINRCLTLFGGLSAKEVTALDHVKMPVLTFQGQLVSGGSSQVFYLGMSPTRQGEVLAKIVAENPKNQKTVIWQDERNSDAIAFSETFERTLTETRKDADAKPLTVATVRFGKDPQWGVLIPSSNTVQPRPQCLVFAGGAQDFNAWLQMYGMAFSLDGIQVLFAGNDGDHRHFNVGAERNMSILVATAFYADPASDKIQAFLKAYREMPPKVEAGIHSALAYDGFRMLIEAMKQTPTQLTPEKVREELLKTKDFAGLTGPLTITAERQVQRPLFVMRWQNGTLTLVKTFP